MFDKINHYPQRCLRVRYRDQCVDPDVQKPTNRSVDCEKKTSQLQSNMIREDALNVLRPAGSHINKELTQKIVNHLKIPPKHVPTLAHVSFRVAF